MRIRVEREFVHVLFIESGSFEMQFRGRGLLVFRGEQVCILLSSFVPDLCFLIA